MCRIRLYNIESIYTDVPYIAGCLILLGLSLKKERGNSGNCWIGPSHSLWFLLEGASFTKSIAVTLAKAGKKVLEPCFERYEIIKWKQRCRRCAVKFVSLESPLPSVLAYKFCIWWVEQWLIKRKNLTLYLWRKRKCKLLSAFTGMGPPSIKTLQRTGPWMYLRCSI